MTPMGVGHDQNAYDRMMHQRFTGSQQLSMQKAAARDRDGFMDTMRGVYAVSGTPYGYAQRRMSQSLADNMVALAPMAAEIAPDLMGQLGGRRGSATVMSRRMIDAGRYRTDAVTGRMGMSPESVQAGSDRIFDDLYSRDSPPQMRGISAGKAGALFGEVQSRGMVYGAAGEGLSRRDSIRRAAESSGVDLGKKGGLSGEDLDKLSLDPAVADKMRSIDAERVKRSVKSYVGAVSAMRDIFGDLGKPNAPMSELMQGLDQLTMGGLGQMDPGKMAQMVRRTYNLSKQTGVGLDNARMMQEHAAAKAQ